MSFQVLAISGSLREGSYNSAILESIKQVSHKDVEIEIYKDQAHLPLFNADLNNHNLETDHSPIMIQNLRRKIREVDAVLFSTPEYAFEIPGVLKNTLDWLVSSGELVDKPVAIISASTSPSGGAKAHEVLVALAKVLSAHVIEQASLCVNQVNKKFDELGNITDTALESELEKVIAVLEKES